MARKTITFDVTDGRTLGREFINSQSRADSLTQGGVPGNVPGTTAVDCGGCAPIMAPFNGDEEGVITVVSGNATLDVESNADQVYLQVTSTRVDSTHYSLSVEGDYIVDVWFDDLHARPEVQWNFDGPDIITTTSELPPEIEVKVAYVTL